MTSYQTTHDERDWALVTGASGGLGQAFARHLARCGVNVALTGRRREVLEQLADELRVSHGVDVVVHPCDIAVESERLDLVSDLSSRGISVETLVNNAGFGTLGEVSQLDPVRLNQEVAVNCEAVVHLCALLVPGMLAAGQGSIVNVASTAAFQPLPGFATYAATKAFVLSFTRALWAETRGTGVRVTAICPGPTETGFFDVAGSDEMMAMARRDPDQVVRTAFDALAHHRPDAVDGLVNRIGARLASLAPTRLTMAAARAALGG